MSDVQSQGHGFYWINPVLSGVGTKHLLYANIFYIYFWLQLLFHNPIKDIGQEVEVDYFLESFMARLNKILFRFLETLGHRTIVIDWIQYQYNPCQKVCNLWAPIWVLLPQASLVLFPVLIREGFYYPIDLLRLFG